MAPRPSTRLFLSWCHEDRSAKNALVEPLRTQLKILGDVTIRWWEDSHLALGEEWRRGLVARMAECDYGVLLLSPGFLASEFIVNEELPCFVGPHAVKSVLPVGLKRVPLDGTREWRGIDRHQIFTHEGRWFAETRDGTRDRFVTALATAIRARVLVGA